MQEYNHRPGHENATDTWGQSAFIAAGKRVVVNIDPATNTTVTAADVCKAALGRKQAYAAELIAIALREQLDGFTLDWEDAVGNDVGCFNELWGYVSTHLRLHSISIGASVDNSNHLGPMDLNSTAPYATEWDWIGYIPWARTLINMGTYPGAWSRGLSFPAAEHLAAVPCPGYPQKRCGLEGQVMDMLAHGVDGPTGQLSPGLSPGVCSRNGSMTANGWTQDALRTFLDFLDTQSVRAVTLWFKDALQLYEDSSTCPWFVPTLIEWAAR